MYDKKTKVECRLVTRGTEKANAKVVDDLAISDPEPDIGGQIIEKEMEMEKDIEDGS